LKVLAVRLLGEVVDLKRIVTAQSDGIARLMGLNSPLTKSAEV
jgi:hypothetical protein